MKSKIYSIYAAFLLSVCALPSCVFASDFSDDFSNWLQEAKIAKLFDSEEGSSPLTTPPDSSADYSKDSSADSTTDFAAEPKIEPKVENTEITPSITPDTEPAITATTTEDSSNKTASDTAPDKVVATDSTPSKPTAKESLTPVKKTTEELHILRLPPEKPLPKTENTSKLETKKKSSDKQTSEELLASKNNMEKTTSTNTSTGTNPVNNTEAEQQLKTVLEYVYANHPALKAKREELKISDEGVAQAVSGFRPNISADLSKGRQRVGNAAETWNYGNAKSRSLDVEQPIFSGGGTIASFNAAKDRVKAVRADLSALEQQTLYDAVVAYTDVVEKQLVLELNQKNVDVLKQQFDATKARFDVGVLTITDVAQASSRLATAQANERQSLGDLEVTKATFARVIGYAPPDKIIMPPVPAGIPESVVQANEWAQSNSPILESARHNEKAAENNIYVNGASILPNVTLQGTMSRANGVSNFLNNSDSDAVKLNIHIPIYQSGAEWSRLRAARNQAQQAKFNTIDTHAAVVESTASAWEGFNTAKAIIASNESAVNAAETALNGVKKENEFGVRTVLDVLDAEQEAFTARVNLVKAERTEKISAYRLIATVGKLTSKELGLETKVEDPQEHYDSIKYQLLGW